VNSDEFDFEIAQFTVELFRRAFAIDTDIGRSEG
jgi:hypothetical protein